MKVLEESSLQKLFFLSIFLFTFVSILTANVQADDEGLRGKESIKNALDSFVVYYWNIIIAYNSALSHFQVISEAQMTNAP